MFRVTSVVMGAALLFTAIGGGCGRPPWEREVAEFAADNGWKFVTVLRSVGSIDHGLTRSLSDLGVYTRVGGVAGYAANYGMYLDHQIAVLGSKNGSLDTILEAVHKTEVLSTIVVLTDSSHEAALREFLRGWRRNAYFFVVDAIDLRWYEVLSARSGFVFDRVKFRAQSRTVNEDARDLHGLQFRSNSLPWKPYYNLENCSESGEECRYVVACLHVI